MQYSLRDEIEPDAPDHIDPVVIYTQRWPDPEANAQYMLLG